MLTIEFPALYQKQKIFFVWDRLYPTKHVLIAPAGTKTGKSFASAAWIMARAFEHSGAYCLWVAPTYLKAKIGYRYCKRYVPAIYGNQTVDGSLEIRLNNGSFIKFIHGSDPETTLEGENIDYFVIDESGKTHPQIYYSLITTITQRRGKGIITGTPRGRNWYYHEYRKALQDDPFYTHTTITTQDSPFVSPDSIEHAKRLLPQNLFDQYYLAKFVMDSSVFGDLSKIFYGAPLSNIKFWVHPDEKKRALDTVTGYDPAKSKDYAVFLTVNSLGEIVGYTRFFQTPYNIQVARLKTYLEKFFAGDKTLRYDATGVGDAVGEMIVDLDIDANIIPITFTNKSKMQMVYKTQFAIEEGWLSCPYITEIEHELSGYEVSVSKTGLFRYSAPEGEHDDIVSAMILAVSGAYESSLLDKREIMMENLFNNIDASIIDQRFNNEDDDFFDDVQKIDDDISISELDKWS